jgi:hypothetical protein
MKLVREHINEKFTDESDPIKDMGIGYREIFDPAKERKRTDGMGERALRKLTKSLNQKIYDNLYDKLVGKTITGEFELSNYVMVKRSIKVKNIKIDFGDHTSSRRIHRMYIISDRGKKYEVDFGSYVQQQYTITA